MLVNAALLNVYFILRYHSIYFFIKKFIFSNVYISVNTIFECIYMFFGWERGHRLSAYATGGGIGGRDPKSVKLRIGGGSAIPHVFVRTYNISFLCFWQHFCLIVSCFILTSSCSSETVIFLQQDKFLPPWNKIFLLKIIFAKQS